MDVANAGVLFAEAAGCVLSCVGWLIVGLVCGGWLLFLPAGDRDRWAGLPSVGSSANGVVGTCTAGVRGAGGCLAGVAGRDPNSTAGVCGAGVEGLGARNPSQGARGV